LRCLITGACGFVGPHLCRYLLTKGDEVAAFSLNGSETLPVGIRFFQGDIREPARVTSVVEEVQPEAVYHLAAISSIGGASRNPNLTFAVNVGGTYNLVEAVRNSRSRARLLNVSTSHVYGHQESITEDSAIEPLTPYATSKAIAELVPRLFVDVDYVTVRPFNHSGPGQNTDYVLPSFAAQIAAMESGLIPPVLEVGDIDIERDFLDVDDVVRAYRLLLEHGQASNIYNLSSGRSYSLRFLLEIFREMATVRFEVKIHSNRLRQGQPQAISAHPGKLQRDTSWVPIVSIRETIRSLLSFWRSKTVLTMAR